MVESDVKDAAKVVAVAVGARVVVGRLDCTMLSSPADDSSQDLDVSCADVEVETVLHNIEC